MHAKRVSVKIGSRSCVRIFFFLLSIFSSLQCCYLAHAAAVSNDDKGGRFGDQLISYLHAKWFSYRYHIPFFLTRFKYSWDLVLDQRERLIEQAVDLPRILLNDSLDLEALLSTQNLIFIPYFPETEWELKYYDFHFAVDWKDPEFRRIANEMVAPIPSLNLMRPPSNCVSIAIHVREGKAADGEHFFQHCSKSPPLQFYVDALLKVIDLCEDKPLYCFIFTDSYTPQEIADFIASKIPQDKQVFFDYRKIDTGDCNNVIEDFFSLYLYDILIRPLSNFSIIPSLLHDFAAVCYPSSFSTKDNIFKVEKIELVINEDLFKQCLEKCASH